MKHSYHMSFNEAKEKGSFLFDKMVSGQLKNYVMMRSYFEWPNGCTYYDTTTYEWKLKPDLLAPM